MPLAILIQAVLLIGAGLLLAPLAVLYGDVQRLMRIVTAAAVLLLADPLRRQRRATGHGSGASRPSSSSSTRSPASSTSTARAFFPDQWAGWGAVGVSAVFSVAIFVVGVVVFRRLEGAVLKEI